MELSRHLERATGRTKLIMRECLFLHALALLSGLTFGSTRLATHLYAEHLLDREHYMEWLVSGLENCTHAKLPMYLLVIQIYWKDLLRLRKYGRRLVAALLNHHTTVWTSSRPSLLYCRLTFRPRFILTLIGTFSHHCPRDYSYSSNHS